MDLQTDSAFHLKCYHCGEVLWSRTTQDKVFQIACGDCGVMEQTVSGSVVGLWKQWWKQEDEKSRRASTVPS